MGRVTGIGGVFLKSADPAALKKWYHDVLGVPLAEHGSGMLSRTDDAQADGGITI